MAHFNLEKELSSTLRLDAPLMKGPLPRWQRKAMENSTPGLSISMNSSVLGNSMMLNASVNKSSCSKTPVKTPQKTPDGKSKSLTPGRGNKTPKTPSGSNGDRFIPNRSGMQFDISHYMLSQKPSEDVENCSPNSKEYRTVMSENLNGDLSSFRIMAYQKKAPLAPTGHSNILKVLYSSSKNPGSTRKATRYIPQTPERILDAPEIVDDYYLNLIDWNVNNYLAVALAGHLYLWNASTGEIQQLMELSEASEYITSVSWLKEGNCLAVGTSTAEVQLWDVKAMKRIRIMKGHVARVAALSWNSYILSSGCRSGFIHHHDVRVANHQVGALVGHSQEVCGLQWSPDGKYLASGGNDNILNIWTRNISHNQAENQPLFTFSDHQAAVKAVSWCPWQPSILATGGGTADRCIKFWNCNLGNCLNSTNTKSQICSILWSKEYKELISGHGFANNELIIWKYPSMTKVAELTGHTARVLHLAMSPDETTVVSAGADETLRLWNCFAVDSSKKKSEIVLGQKASSKLITSIR